MTEIAPDTDTSSRNSRGWASAEQTEFGLVNLKGKSVPEWAKAMISLAHPDVGADLERDARANGLVPKAIL